MEGLGLLQKDGRGLIKWTGEDMNLLKIFHDELPEEDKIINQILQSQNEKYQLLTQEEMKRKQIDEEK